MKIAYITAQTPYGPGESFILPEVIELRRQGHEVVVFPLRPADEIHRGRECEEVAKYTVRIPLVSFPVLLQALGLSLLRPSLIGRIISEIIKCSGSAKKILKNLSVLPKGLVLGEEIRKKGFDHIHAHWASTPSTAAYIASLYSGVPWSFTAHRWDIAEANMLVTKVKSCQFVRAIGRNGAEEIKQQIPKELWAKVTVVHMGVEMPQFLGSGTKEGAFTLACIAGFVPKKGHRFLLEACSLLKQKGFSFRCLLIGDGPLKEEIQELSRAMDLEDIMEFKGRLPHDEVLGLYGTGLVSTVVLPSIVTEDGEKEGIPVALMEAMAAGIPVVSTITGDIPELLEGGAGILVPPGDSKALADAIEVIMENPYYRTELGQKGRKKIEADFSLSSVVKQLAELFQKHT